MNMDSTSLLERIDRLESLDAIRQLAGKYALALDMRDMDAMANCFAPDVRVGRDKSGRAHLKAWLDETMRKQFHGTSHHLGQHIIEFSDPDHATGVVYSKNEHETGPEWVIMQMLYWDDYERIDGRWCFRRRLPCYWYATDLNKPPIGGLKMRWPGREPYAGVFTSCSRHGIRSGHSARIKTHCHTLPNRHRWKGFWRTCDGVRVIPKFVFGRLGFSQASLLSLL